MSSEEAAEWSKAMESAGFKAGLLFPKTPYGLIYHKGFLNGLLQGFYVPRPETLNLNADAILGHETSGCVR